VNHDSGWRKESDNRSLRAHNPSAIVPRALNYLRPYRASAALIAVCLITVASVGAVPPLLVRELIDVALPEGDRGLLSLLVLAMIAVPIGSGLISVLQNYLNASVRQRIMFDIRNQLYNHVQGLSLRFFTASRTGEVMSRLTDDVSAIQNTVTGSLISIASNFFTVAITLVVIFTLNWQLALLGVSLLPLSIYPTRLVGRLRRNLQRETQRTHAEMNAKMQETLNVSGFLQMKVFTQERSEADQLRDHSHRLMMLQVRQALIGRWFFMLMGLFSFVGPALIYWWAAIR
jgi:ATP-binding cassette subfamily B protein